MDDWFAEEEKEESYHGKVIEMGGFADEHPARFDQKTAELAEKMQKADGYVVYLYTRTGERTEGGIEGVGHCAVALCPGVLVTSFLHDALQTIVEVMKECFNQSKGCDEDGDT